TQITVRDRVGASRVVIEADPRTPAEAVADSYRRARSAETMAQLELPETAARNHRLEGSRLRQLTPKSAPLAVHLARHPELNWPHRRQAWNTAAEGDQPDWAYAEDAGFARDSCRAWEQVVGERFLHKRPLVRTIL